MSILKDLYDGNIFPSEHIIPDDLDHRAISNKISEEREYFMSKIPPEDIKRFEEWEGLLLKYSNMFDYANFAYGFRLGGQLMYEVCNNDRSEE